MRNVIGGNSYRAARPPGGGLYVEPPDCSDLTEVMIKKILKWTAVIVICFFAAIVAVAILAPESVPSPVGATGQVVAQITSTTTSEASVAQASSSTQVATGNKVAAQSQTIPPATPSKTPAPSKPAPTSSQYTYYPVTKVVDGDTIAINLGGTSETIRLIGINTPETVDPRKPVECFGKQASDEAKALLSGKKVRIEKDPTQGDRDKYGRLLAYVWRDDGLFFNEVMILQGYAYEYTYDKPYKYQPQFKANQATAKSQSKGLWAPDTCDGSLSTSSTADTPTPAATSPSGHTFYLSTYYTSKYYYCDTDDGWKSLSANYLKSYSSEQTLLAAYPSRTLHEPCK